jgi:hypothetical protein
LELWRWEACSLSFQLRVMVEETLEAGEADVKSSLGLQKS